MSVLPQDLLFSSHIASVHIQYAQLIILRCMYVCTLCLTTFATPILWHVTPISSCRICAWLCGHIHVFIELLFEKCTCILGYADEYKRPGIIHLKNIKKNMNIYNVLVSINIKDTFHNRNVKRRRAVKSKNKNTRFVFAVSPKMIAGFLKHKLTLENNSKLYLNYVMIILTDRGFKFDSHAW